MAMIGNPIDRVDGLLKVTGKAKYAAEFNVAGLVYGMPVRATISKGSVSSIDTTAAMKSPGVLAVLTHENAPRLNKLDTDQSKETNGNLGEQLVPLQDNKVHYYGQYIALVVAKTYEQARAAAAMVKPTYDADKAALDLVTALPNAESHKSQGAKMCKSMRVLQMRLLKMPC